MQLSASMATVVALFSLLDKGSHQFYEAGVAAVQIVPEHSCWLLFITPANSTTPNWSSSFFLNLKIIIKPRRFYQTNFFNLF